MRIKRLFTEMLGVERAVVERVEVDERGSTVIVQVRPDRRWMERPRCGVCGATAPGYDNGDGVRRWRALDLGRMAAVLEAKAPRVRCPEHGVVVAAVPWARHRSAFTSRFEDLLTWLATQCSMSAVGEMLRVTWRTVVHAVERALCAVEQRRDRLDGLVRLGIDEISHPKGQRYLTIVVNLDTGELVWAAPGRDERTVAAFFDALGPERSARIEAVAADGAEWIRRAVKKRCPTAALCLDPFHVVSWATDALDQVRRQAWNEARRSTRAAQAKALKDARFALWKAPEDLTPRQDAVLRQLEQANGPVWTAYVLKEELRGLVCVGSDATTGELVAWAAKARHSGLEPFQKLAASIERHREAIENTLRLGLTNARVESLNTKLRVVMRRAFGFHSAASLIRLAMLGLGSGQPRLPACA